MAQAGWIIRQPLPDRVTRPPQLAALEAGEAEVIILALGMTSPAVVLLDDRPARRVAEEMGLIVLGTAGVLLLAKDAGLVSSIRPLLADLRYAGLYLAEVTAEEVLAIAGEG